MNNRTIIWILRIILFVCLIIFWITFETTAKTNCEACSFEINNESLSAEEFFQLYHNECIVVSRFIELPKNFTIKK